MSHHRNNRSARFQIFRSVFLFHNSLSNFRTYIFGLESEFFSHQIDCFSIQTLIDGNHDTDTHTSGDYLVDRNIHHRCQFISRNEFGQLQHLAVRHFLIFQFLHTVGSHLAFLFTIFGSLILTFGCQTSKSLFYLLCYIFLAYLLFDNRFLEAILIIIFTVIIATLVVATIVTAFALHIRSRSSKARSSHVVHVHLLFVDTVPFFLVSGCVNIIFHSTLLQFRVILANLFDDSFFHQLLLILTDFLFLFTFTAFLFLRFFLRTGRLVQCSQVNLTDYIDFRTQFRLTDLEYLFFFRSFFLYFYRCLRGYFRRYCFHRLFHAVMFFRLHRCNFYLRLFFNHFLHYFFNFCRLLFHYRFRLFHRFRFYSLRLLHRLCLFDRFNLFSHRFRLNRCYHLFYLHLRFLPHFRLSYWTSFNSFFLLFRFFLNFLSSTTVQFIQVNFPDRFKLRACILRYDCFDHIFRLRFFRLLFKAFNRNRRLITILILTFLNETLRLKSKVLICTKLFYEYSVLLLANFCIRISLNGIPLLLQELNYRRDSYVQISCNFV